MKVLTPPQKPEDITLFSRFPGLDGKLFYVWDEGNLFLLNTNKDSSQIINVIWTLKELVIQ